jgi:hypothetical protein
MQETLFPVRFWRCRGLIAIWETPASWTLRRPLEIGGSLHRELDRRIWVTGGPETIPRRFRRIFAVAADTTAIAWKARGFVAIPPVGGGEPPGWTWPPQLSGCTRITCHHRVIEDSTTGQWWFTGRDHRRRRFPRQRLANPAFSTTPASIASREITA